MNPPESRRKGPRETTEHSVAPEITFTDYVRHLDAGAPPSEEVFKRLWQRLRGALVSELKRRSLWHVRPRCLGIIGPASWQEPGAIDELVGDCYRFVFLSRLGRLRVHLQIKRNIDGLVFRSIGNYLYDRQKKHDPLGFRTFTTLQLAIRHGVDQGHLVVLAGDPRVRNDTCLAFAASALPVLPMQVRDPDEVDELRRTIASWNDELLTDLVTARGKGLDPLVERLAERVGDLRGLGVEGFTFAEILTLLKNDARQRWNAIWIHDGGVLYPEEGDEGREAMPTLLSSRPDVAFEERQFFEYLTLCVSEELEKLAEPPRIRDRLRRLWTFLRYQVSERGEEQTISRRRLSRLLEIPRDSMNDLYGILGRLLNRCRGLGISGDEGV